MPLLVVFAILFPAIHSYEHIQSHDHVINKSVLTHQDSGKKEFKVQDHANEECAICHFKFSPVSAFNFVYFDFHKSSGVIPYVYFYFTTDSGFFKGSLFALRAPPKM